MDGTVFVVDREGKAAVRPVELGAMVDGRWIVEGGAFQVLVDESKGPKHPRVDLEQPDNSLLLSKPATWCWSATSPDR